MEPAIAESKELNQALKNPTTMLVSDDNSIAITAGNDRSSLFFKVKQTFNLTNTVKHADCKDELYSQILENPKAHTLFGCKDGLVFTKNLLKWDLLCVPCEAFQKGRRVIKIIIYNNWPFRPIQNCTRHQKILLVNIYGARHRSILHIMWCMCCGQRRK